VPKAWWLGEPPCSHFPSFILQKTSIRKLAILLVAKSRSSLSDVALSIGNNTFWCGRIPLIFQCSLRFISKFSRCSRSGRLEILHVGSGSLTLFHSATSLTPALSADFSGIFFLLRTSPMTCYHLLLAPKPAPQATCQKCRRHGS